MEILTEISRTISDDGACGDVVVDLHGQIEPIDETDFVEIFFPGSVEYPLSHRRCDYSRSIIGVAELSTVTVYGKVNGMENGRSMRVPTSLFFSPPVWQEPKAFASPGFEVLQSVRPQTRASVELPDIWMVVEFPGGAANSVKFRGYAHARRSHEALTLPFE